MATSDFHNSCFLELDVKWTCVVPLREETKQMISTQHISKGTGLPAFASHKS